MDLEVLDHRTITEAQARELATHIVTIWPRPGRTVDTRTADIYGRWHNHMGPEAEYPRSFIIREGGRIVAHAQADPRTIRTKLGNVKVLALCRVFTLPEVRGKNFGRAVVETAFQLVDNGTFPFSLFQTSDEVCPFYEKLGAVKITNQFYNSLADDRTANPWWSPVLMRYPATGNWPEGEIDLNGPGW